MFLYEQVMEAAPANPERTEEGPLL